MVFSDVVDVALFLGPGAFPADVEMGPVCRSERLRYDPPGCCSAWSAIEAQHDSAHATWRAGAENTRCNAILKTISRVQREREVGRAGVGGVLEKDSPEGIPRPKTIKKS